MRLWIASSALRHLPCAIVARSARDGLVDQRTSSGMPHQEIARTDDVPELADRVPHSGGQAFNSATRARSVSSSQGMKQ